MTHKSNTNNPVDFPKLETEMNERIIKELLARPGLERLNDWVSIGPVQRAALEDCIELVVRDCASYIHEYELFIALLNRYGVKE
jgi:hypothetical protein